MRSVFLFIQPGIFPLVVGVIFLFFSLTYYSLGLPDPAELQVLLEMVYEQYGYLALFLASFLEAFFVLSFYFPGSLVIVLSVLAAGGDFSQLSTLALIVGFGAYLGICADYFLGRFGLHRFFEKFGGAEGLNRAKEWQFKWGSMAFLLFGFHPNFLSLLSTHAGISQAPFGKVAFYSFLSLLIWTPVAVTLIAAVVEEVEATSNSQHWYVFGFFMIWSVLLMLLAKLKESR